MARKKEPRESRQLDAVIYARRSSDRQNEESTSQQITVCKDMAMRLGYNVVRVYADEAKTGKTDRRPEFQKLVRAVESGKCDIVIAYKSNRISRNMLQALTYESKFEKAGVRILYAKEEFGDNAAGRFALRNMMNLNQFYSENMSEDIKRCLYAYAEECKVLNGRIPLGYVKGEDGRYALATDGSVEIVQEIFSLYASGIKSSAICQALNARGVKAPNNKKFDVGILDRIMNNQKYIGVYEYGDIRIEGGVPRIVTDDLWRKVKERLQEAHRAPSKSWSMTEYLLTGKIFCGHCGSTMIGETGRSRNGTPHHYYVCYKKKKVGKHTCDKKRVRQGLIEDMVIDFTVNHVLSDEIIDQVAEEAVRIQNSDSYAIQHQQHIKALAEVRKKINNIVQAIADGFRTPAMKTQLEELSADEERLSRLIAEEAYRKPTFTKEQLVDWMRSLKNGDTNSPSFKRQIIDIFVNAIYLYDDHFTISYNTKERKEAMPYSVALAAESSSVCSPSNCSGPPNDVSANTVTVVDGLFLFRVNLII